MRGHNSPSVAKLGDFKSKVLFSDKTLNAKSMRSCDTEVGCNFIRKTRTITASV